MPSKVILASTIAAPFLKEITDALVGLPKPKLVGFLANHDLAAQKYADSTDASCKEVGIEFELRKVEREDLEDAIVEANQDEKVSGIMVYYPVFGDGQDRYIQNVIAPEKDVEGLGHKYIYNLYHNIRFLDSEKKKKSILPCTPLAIVKILEHLRVYNSILTYGNRLHGKTVTLINRSEVVGRPLAALLANDGARVYSADINGIQEYHRGPGITFKRHIVTDVTISLNEALGASDVVISGVPVKDYKVSTGELKEGVVAINFSEFKNFNEDIRERASLYVPSVGKVTIRMLQRNLVRLHQNS